MAAATRDGRCRRRLTATPVVNKIRGTLQIVAVTGYGDRRKACCRIASTQNRDY